MFFVNFNVWFARRNGRIQAFVGKNLTKTCFSLKNCIIKIVDFKPHDRAGYFCLFRFLFNNLQYRKKGFSHFQIACRPIFVIECKI